MYRILIAGPPGFYPGCPIDVNSDTTNLFASEQAICFSSVDPADLADCDGVIVPGGLPDVGPDYWGEENIACSVLDHEMDVVQFRMIDEAVKRHKPMIGFCRGHQLSVSELPSHSADLGRSSGCGWSVLLLWL